MSEITLLVLAAGIGRRFEGLKQVKEVGPSGEAMVDYAVYDALRSGFGRIVFVIRRGIEEVFRRSIGDFWEGRATVRYVYQEIDEEPAAGRRKPWGTAHAVLLSRSAVQTPFAAINADDFYGPGAYRSIAAWLNGRAGQAAGAVEEFCFVGYPLKNTLSDQGYVSRGICAVDGDGYLAEVIERPRIEKAPNGARALGESGRWLNLSGEEVASMNFWGFTPAVFPLLERGFSAFLELSGKDTNAEYYLPSAVNEMIAAGEARVRYIPTAEAWFGMTYPGELARVKSWVRELVKQGVYPENLRAGGAGTDV
jgi:UTP-glucose-1-phosphate uridylyltransferase